MFYSHEILTSREHGVATVWLVATLGSKSALRKVTRKAILDVDVPGTCKVILQPGAPMALRLQSSLLYGVSSVYSQQCGYVLSDAQTAQTNMRTLLKVVHTSSLDPDAGKANRDQLMVQNDPSMVANFGFGFDMDLSALDIPTDGSSRLSSILSPESQRSSLSSQQGSKASMIGLVIPSSSSGIGGAAGGLDISDEVGSFQPLPKGLLDDEEGFQENAGFVIGPEGEIVETPIADPAGRRSVAGRVQSMARNDSAIRDRVRQDLEEGMLAGQLELGDPIDFDLFRDDNVGDLLPPGDPFPEMQRPGPVDDSLAKSPSPVRPEESSMSAEAPQQRKRREPKVLPTDVAQELHNADLASWNNNYLENMAHATLAKAQYRHMAVAKKNAATWVLGTGIGGVGLGLGASKLQSPLDMFAGDALLEALTGRAVLVAGRKRSHDEEVEHTTDSEGRRVRAREDDGGQIGRGDGAALNDDQTLGINDDSIEVGRDAPAALEDVSMPWNVSSSIARGYAGSLGGGFGTSGGRPSFLPPRAGSAIRGSLDLRASRITSASPLVGRGLERLSSLELPTHEDEDEDELLGNRTIQGSEANDFELYGPAAGVSTQTAAESQWIRATLDRESNNFLEFVKAEIAAKEERREDVAEEGATDMSAAVTFEELLPPTQHSKIVASQALLHVLSLATKGLISVQQQVGYGPITIYTSAGV